jgi:hypothetical protein
VGEHRETKQEIENMRPQRRHLLRALLGIFLITLCLCSHATWAQSKRPCSANLRNAALRGINLGTGKAEIKKLFPAASWTPKPDGSEVSTISTFEDKARFDGVYRLKLESFDDRIYSVEVTYESDSAPQNVGLFGDELRKALKIPERWQGSGIVLLIDCRERIALAMLAVPSPPIRMSILLADNLVSRDIARREKEKLKPFKP